MLKTQEQVPTLIGSNQDDGLILTTSLVTALYLYHYFTVHKVTDPSLYLLYRTLWPVVAPGILFHIPVEDSSIEASQQLL